MYPLVLPYTGTLDPQHRAPGESWVQERRRREPEPCTASPCPRGWEAQRPQHRRHTPFWIPGNSKGAESDTRQQKELLPDGLWYKPPPSFICQIYRAAGNGGGREEDETVGGRLTQKSLGATDAMNSSE